MKVNKIWFFPCLCLLLLGMISIVRASGQDSLNLLLDTGLSTSLTVTPTATTETDNARAHYLGIQPPANKPTVWQQTAYYGMRATLPLYNMTTSYAPWVVSGVVLGALLGGGEGFTSLIGGTIGGAVGGKIARSLQERGKGWMRAYLRSALKADIEEGVAIANALTTFKTCAKKHALIAGVEPRAFVQKTIDEIKKQH